MLITKVTIQNPSNTRPGKGKYQSNTKKEKGKPEKHEVLGTQEEQGTSTKSEGTKQSEI